MLLVADLRRALETLDDNLPVVIPGGEADYTDIKNVGMVLVEWSTDEHGQDLANPVERCCVVIE